LHRAPNSTKYSLSFHLYPPIPLYNNLSIDGSTLVFKFAKWG